MALYPDIEALHAPYAALLRAALGLATPRGARVALDLACGAGAKTPWLAELAAPAALVLGLDLAPAAVAAARAGSPGGHWLVADAHRLPLQPGSLDVVWCVAALGLLEHPAVALAEARRALRPGGALIVTAAGERWVRPRPWPPALLAALGEQAPPPPADDLGADLRGALAAAGFRQPHLTAYLLGSPGLSPAAAALPLAAWKDLEPLAAARLHPADQAACRAAEAQAEPEPLPVLLLARGEAAL